MRAHGLQPPTAKAVLEATGATKSQAYELCERLDELLPTLERPPGRPPTPDPAPGADVESECAKLLAISSEFLRFLYARPGAIRRGDHRLNFCPEAKRHIVELCHEHRELGTEKLAKALSIPASTLREWDREADEHSSATQEHEQPDVPAKGPNMGDAQLQTVLSAWHAWKGTFSAFCNHIRVDHAIDLGRTALSSLLEAAGVRAPKKRSGRSPDEKAMRDSFLTFFPGAQWTEDGKTVHIEINGQRHRFNLELMVDVHTAAYVGIEVREEEDAKGVVGAYMEGLRTTGSAPLAVLLDNKACNWTLEVEQSTGESMCIAATLARPQNKAHVEGAFGLFSQQVPDLTITADTERGVARAIVELISRTFFNCLNMRPRKSRGNRSRIDLYSENAPTEAEIERAKIALKARLERQRKARETRRAREDPGTRCYLENAFQRLNLEDPTGHVRDAIARYSMGDIADGVAIFAAKKQEGTLPDQINEPARYLMGIIRNLEQEREGAAIARALYDERMAARDCVLEPLHTKREALVRANSELKSQLRGFIDEAFRTESQIERHFWLSMAAATLLTRSGQALRDLYEYTARRVRTAFRIPYAERLRVTRFISSLVVPLG